jgi:Ca2+ transporting ATPase
MADRFRIGEHETDIPFGPIRKRQVVVITPNRENPTYVRIVVKGAPEYVMGLCTQILTPNGDAQELSPEDADEILNQQILLPFASVHGLRTLAYAYKDMDKQEWEELQAEHNNFAKEEDREIIESNLTFVAGFGINDDLRPGVANSIAQLQKAGINIRIISGDAKYTAIECAKKVGVLKDGEENVEFTVMEGKEFREYFGGIIKVKDSQGNDKFEFGDRKKFIQVARHVKVLYRSTPQDKFALIAGLQNLKSSIAVTADGLADATSLKQANVGFCMGISGCELAKDSADIVILDDNFNSVFRATQWGKNILDNIRKFIQFQLTVNIVCMVLVFLGGSTIGVSPFSVIQMLWINMIMDTLAALSLATEPPHIDDFQTAQQKKGDKIILPVMWRNILGQALYQLVILIAMLYSVPYWFGIDYPWIGTSFTDSNSIPILNPATGEITGYDVQIKPEATNMKQHYTIIFHTFVMMNLFNQINCRKLSVTDLNIFKRFFNNFYFLIVLAGEFAAQWFIVEWGGLIFRTAPLTW